MSTINEKYYIRNWLADIISGKFPFVAYRLPSQSVAKGFRVTDARPIHLPDIENECPDGAFVVAPFDMLNRKIVALMGEGQPSQLFLSEPGTTADETIIRDTFVEDDSSRKAYSVVFQQMMHALEQKDVEKVVLARRMSVNSPAPDLLPFLFEQLCRSHPNAFVYFIDHPQTGRWIGASPELFLQKKGDVIETVAQAATRSTKAHSGHWNHKELEEQGLVSVFIDGVLKKFGLPEVEREGPVSTPAGEMVHLKTLYRFKAAALHAGIGNFIHALHPTPALCGLPKENAMQLIRSFEGFPRELYGGFLGPVKGDEFQFFVNIRCMKMNPGNTFLYLGGGLTRGSDEQQEWEETRLKARTLLNAISAVKKIKI